MEPSLSESKPGYYHVYYTESGERLLVLNGLSAEDQNEPHVLHDFMLQHYSAFEAGYWILLVVTFVYMTGVHIILPLWNRLRTQNVSAQ